MKNQFKIVAVAFMLLSAITSCKKSFDSLYQNPNKPSSVPASLLLNGILNNMYDAPYSMQERWSQYYLCNYDYYGNNRYDFGSGDNYFSTLKNVTKMEEEAKNAGLPDLNPYTAMAKFFKAYFFTKMSLEMGDIPMTEALQGSSNLNPAYDPQKQVFQQAFAWLDSANAEMSSLISDGSLTMAGDIYYDNNLLKWQKAINTYRVRLLIELSKKVDDPDLNIKQQFATIVGNKAQYPLMESNDDNLVYTYIYPTNNYPMNPGNFGFDALRYNTSATYIGMLTKFKDPRVFVTAEPAGALVSAGKSPTDFAAFVGANPGEDLGAMYIEANNGEYSLINRKHYYDTYTGEPSIQIGYPELCFNIAEAINRGWISGNAEDYYKAGMQASWAFYNIPLAGALSVYFLHPGASLGTYDNYSVDVNFDTYYNQPAVKYAGSTTGLTQILQQRYLALFRHSGLESYYTWRRTGVPTFTTGPGTGNSERIAMRFKYPSSEQTANTKNYDAALQSQYGGNDDINGIMWLLK